MSNSLEPRVQPDSAAPAGTWTAAIMRVAPTRPARMRMPVSLGRAGRVRVLPLRRTGRPRITGRAGGLRVIATHRTKTHRTDDPRWVPRSTPTSPQEAEKGRWTPWPHRSSSKRSQVCLRAASVALPQRLLRGPPSPVRGMLPPAAWRAPIAAFESPVELTADPGRRLTSGRGRTPGSGRRTGRARRPGTPRRAARHDPRRRSPGLLGVAGAGDDAGDARLLPDPGDRGLRRREPLRRRTRRRAR